MPYDTSSGRLHARADVRSSSQVAESESGDKNFFFWPKLEPFSFILQFTVAKVNSAYKTTRTAQLQMGKSLNLLGFWCSVKYGVMA